MNHDNLSILILRSYIRRLWTWIECFGIVLLILGFILIYGETGLLDPVRNGFTPARQSWWSIVIFSAAAGCVVSASLVGFMISRALTLEINTGSNPVLLTSDEMRCRIAEAMLEKVRSMESTVWMFASCPALFGAILYAIGRSAGVMFLYFTISVATAAIFIPTLAQTEKLVDKFFKKHLSASNESLKTGGI